MESDLLGAIGLFLATFVSEDAATISGGLLASQGAIGMWIALAALYVGVVLGDLGLYGMGRMASWHQGLREWIGEHRISDGRDWIEMRLIASLIGARFVPGMRLATYTASGYLRVSFFRFAIVAILATAVWTTALFFVIYWLGYAVIDRLGPYRWPATAAFMAVVLTFTVLIPWLRARRRARSHKP